MFQINPNGYMHEKKHAESFNVTMQVKIHSAFSQWFNFFPNKRIPTTTNKNILQLRQKKHNKKEKALISNKK